MRTAIQERVPAFRRQQQVLGDVQNLNAAIAAAPDSAFASIGGKGVITGALPLLAPSDISSTGPGGPKDAKSVGIKLQTVSATITGFSP